MKRDKRRLTENLGVDVVRRYCSTNDLIFQAEPREDYGIDCYVEVAHEDTPLNFVVGVQIKSGKSYRYEPKERPGTFRVYIDERHIAYWSAANIPVVFVYVDEHHCLWWLHVGRYLEEKSLAADNLSYFEFVRQSGDSEVGLAIYLRELQSRTPSTTHRLEVASCNAPRLLTGDRSITMSEEGIRDHLSTPEILDARKWVAEFVSDGPDVIVENQVAGYSPDGRWVGYLRATEIGRKCMDYRFFLLDRHNWAHFECPIWTEADHDAEEPLSEADLSERLKTASHLIEKAELTPAAVFQIDEHLWQDDSPPTKVAFVFGGVEFDVEVANGRGHSALVLTAPAFVPRRQMTVAGRLSRPINYYNDCDGDPDDPNLTAWGVAKAYDHLAAIHISRDANILTFIIGTNEENYRWGTVEYDFVHISMGELRQLCLECLRS